MQPNREELAWAAGFFDGEGTTTASGSNPFSVNLQVPQCHEEALRRFKKAVGGLGKIYGPFAPSGLGKKPEWRYRLWGFEQVQAVIAMLWSFLGTPKREQATRVLLGYRTKIAMAPSLGRGQNTCKYGHDMLSDNRKNLYIYPSGARSCRVCTKIAGEGYRQRKAAA